MIIEANIDGSKDAKSIIEVIIANKLGGNIMSKVLYIKANIKPEGVSRTFQVSDYFLEEYKKQHPEDEITVLDLYQEKVDFLRPADLEVMGQVNDESKKNTTFLKYAFQFAEADKYVFAAPMWNLGFPAILKAYIDYITITGITFHYTEEGPKGLLQNKKAVHIVARGGEYGDAPYEMGDRYLRTILNFFGVNDIQTIAIENMDIVGADVAAKVNEGKEKAKLVVKEF